jgi:hypothetical protein
MNEKCHATLEGP